MKINKIWVPTVVLVATMENYGKVEASCAEVCQAGLVACMGKCSVVGAFMPLGMPACVAGCGIATGICIAACH
ncbi:MAG: hypothetical protein mread185_000123 [Mycoplasmataceae bacterium]|nr:MAG: hypothetical protein mread185_000123 [Mycoplasmataceae bacterium]